MFVKATLELQVPALPVAPADGVAPAASRATVRAASREGNPFMVLLSL
jgi:hypothetical protein